MPYKHFSLKFMSTTIGHLIDGHILTKGCPPLAKEKTNTQQG